MSEFIVHVDESDFEYEVLQYSTRVPVVVDFWADWCIPCRVLGPKLEALAREGEGRFRLAKVNVDENNNLARRYKVRNLPAVKGFADGRVVAEFAGVLADEGLRDFIRRLTPAPEDLLFAKGKSLIELGDYAEAEDAFREFLSVHPDHPGALLGLVRVLLMQGKSGEPVILLRNFPASPAYNTAQLLKPVASAYSASAPDALEVDDPLEAAYWNGIRLAKRGNVLAAMDGYLGILRQDKTYRNGEVKDVFVGWLALIGEDHPDARDYRQELSKVLF
ncbi:MAG: tetratricopeptide repeat protein [Chloroflexota bacterium]|nr:tetratricopeptide repeat protein [Chloroflexota bacterium]